MRRFFLGVMGTEKEIRSNFLLTLKKCSQCILGSVCLGIKHTCNSESKFLFKYSTNFSSEYLQQVEGMDYGSRCFV